MTGFDIISFVEASTPEDCREAGQLLIQLADSPRDATWPAKMAIARNAVATPQQRSLADIITERRKRVHALSDALRADGMDHCTLAEAELVRRGDPRSFEEYQSAIADAG